MISYGGVPLLTIDPGLAARVEDTVAVSDLYDASFVSYPGPQLAALCWPAIRRQRPPKLGTLYWPAGASQWAVGYFAATDAMLAKIRPLVNPNNSAGSSWVPQTLTIKDGPRTITFKSMYMLPPRPLTGAPGNKQSWLLTLVDQRFLWWQSAASITVSEGSTLWSDLYASVGAALGVTINADAVSSAYLTPPKLYGVAYDSLPLLLDAVAAAVGQRIVCWPDGTVYAWGTASSSAQVVTNLRNASPTLAGGAPSLNSATSPNDLNLLVPKSVTVAFPTVSSGAYTSGFTAKNVTLSSLALADFQGVTGNGQTQVLHAVQPLSATDAQLTAWAQEAATDFYRHLISGEATVYSGACPWAPEGYDSIEWTHHRRRISTRVERMPWNVWQAPPALPAPASLPPACWAFDNSGMSVPSGTATRYVWNPTSGYTGTQFNGSATLLAVGPATGGGGISIPSGFIGASAGFLVNDAFLVSLTVYWTGTFTPSASAFFACHLSCQTGDDPIPNGHVLMGSTPASYSLASLSFNDYTTFATTINPAAVTNAGAAVYHVVGTGVFDLFLYQNSGSAMTAYPYLSVVQL